MKSNIRILCFFIFLLICSPANYQITGFDGRGVVVIICTWIFLLLTKQLKRIKKHILNPPVISWAVLMSYHLINAVGKTKTDIWHGGIPTTVVSVTLMILISYIYCRNKLLLFKTLLVSTFYYLLIAYLYCNTTEADGRLSGFIYTTQLGQLAGVTCIIISMYLGVTQKMKLSFLYLYPLFIIVLAGARNGLLVAGFGFLCLFILYVFRNKKIIFAGCILLIVVSTFLEDTHLFERLTDTNHGEILLASNTFLDNILGERIFYYTMGIKNFMDCPITGIGLLNFMDYNNYTYILHSEIMTHLAEGGLIAFFIYLYFKFWFIKNFLKYASRNTPYLNQCIVAFLALVVLGITARIFQYNFFFILYGIIIGEILTNINKRTYLK